MKLFIETFQRFLSELVLLGLSSSNSPHHQNFHYLKDFLLPKKDSFCSPVRGVVLPVRILLLFVIGIFVALISCFRDTSLSNQSESLFTWPPDDIKYEGIVLGLSPKKTLVSLQHGRFFWEAVAVLLWFGEAFDKVMTRKRKSYLHCKESVLVLRFTLTKISFFIMVAGKRIKKFMMVPHKHSLTAIILLYFTLQ